VKKFYFITPLIFQTIVWPIRPFLILFGLLEVRGIENIKNLPNGIIFASNHSSELDPILLPASFPLLSRFLPIFYVSREKKFYDADGIKKRIYGGMFFKLWGAHPAYFGLHDYEKSLVNHIELLKHKKNIMIFPEGKIPADGKIGEARGGVAYLAYRTNAPIVPVAISGSRNFTFKDFFTGKGHIILSIGKPITTQELLNNINLDNPEAYKIAAQKLMNIIEKMLPNNISNN